MEKKKAAIFDLDGTLCDVRSIRHLVLGPKRNFHAFHTASADCPPNPDVVADALRAEQEGLDVLIVTARMERYRRLSSMWLAVHGVPSVEMFMRSPGDYRKDFVVKQEVLARIRSRWEPVHAWDDRPEVAKLWEDEGIPVTLVPGWED